MKIDIKPMSANQCWQGRRFKTKEYKIWGEQISWLLKDYPKKEPPYLIEVTFHTNQDLDNCLKSFLDSLQDAGIITNDRYVEKIVAVKQKCKRNEEFIEFEVKRNS